MAYARLLDPKVRAKLQAEFGWTPPAPQIKPNVTIVFTKTRPIPVEDWPIKSTDARSYTKMHALLEAQNHRCAYCGIEVKTYGWGRHCHDRATIDHVVPKAAGGPCCWSNEIVACQLCNQGRGAMRAERYFEKVQESGRMLAAVWGRQQQREASRRKITVFY